VPLTTRGWIARGKDVVKIRPQDKGGSTSSCRPGLESGSTLASPFTTTAPHLHQSSPTHRQPQHLSLCAHTLCSSRLPVHPWSSANVQPASPSISAPTLLCTPTIFSLSFEQSQPGSIILPPPTPSLCVLRRACTGASSKRIRSSGSLSCPTISASAPSVAHAPERHLNASDLSALAPTFRAALHQLPSSLEASASRTALSSSSTLPIGASALHLQATYLPALELPEQARTSSTATLEPLRRTRMLPIGASFRTSSTTEPLRTHDAHAAFGATSVVSTPEPLRALRMLYLDSPRWRLTLSLCARCACWTLIRQDGVSP